MAELSYAWAWQCAKSKVFFTIENPTSSMLWSMPQCQFLESDAKAFFANFHMPGLGKTATCVQYFAALELLHNGGATALVSVPLMTLLHWKETFERWIDGTKLPPGWLLATNKAEKLPTSAAALAPLASPPPPLSSTPWSRTTRRSFVCSSVQ